MDLEMDIADCGNIETESLKIKRDGIHVGRQFATYQEFIEFLEIYEKETKQKFYKKRSQGIQSARRLLQRELKDSLCFYRIEYECVHGQERHKRGNGLKKTSTLRMGCKAYFKIAVCSTGKYLNIKKVNLIHTNHDNSELVFEHLYDNRKLNGSELEAVKTYLSLDANKKKIQNKILTDLGKKATLKDLHNINYKLKLRKNDLEEAIQLLRNKYCCNVHLLCDDGNNFKALQFSTESMRNAMCAYPEFVSIDGTYKLIDIGCTVFLCLIEDANGQSEIVCVSLLSTEDRDTYHWVFDTFKTQMNTDRLMCFMGDKDLVECDVIKEIFPNTPVYSCLLHTLKTFRREINCEKLNISREDRELSLEYLQKLVFTNSDSEYNNLYIQFKECVPQSVSSYFDKNWHNIRDEWLVCKMSNFNLKNTTNNRMESINSKIKQVVPKNWTLLEFIKNFFIFLESNNHEHDTQAANHILRKPLQNFEKHASDLKLYADYLTSYSFSYVQKQIKNMKNVNIMKKLENGVFEVSSLKGALHVTTDTCHCRDFSSMRLPCHHILAVRNHQKVSLLEKSLCHIRWTKEHYLTTHRIPVTKEMTVTNDIPEVAYSIKERKKIMTLTEKRKAATLVTSSLVNLISLTSDSEFSYKIDLLKKWDHLWKIGKEVTLETVNDSAITEDQDHEIEFETNDLSNANAVNPSTEEAPDEYHLIENEELLTTHNNCPEEMANENNNIINKILLPPKISKRGRPKGHDMTVIGLKKRRNKNIPVKFILQPKAYKIFYIINLILNENLSLSSESVKNEIFQIRSQDIKDELPDAILDSSIEWEHLKIHFTSDGCDSLQTKIEEKKIKNMWTCRFCSQILAEEPSIICECCLFWYHLKCSSLSRIPEIKSWFCVSCYNGL